MFLIDPIRNFYARFERPISSLSLILGFVFDAVTLKRVDTLWENIWVFAHLVIVATFIVLIHVQESEVGDEHDPSKKHFWYVNILQFFFGGILSTYLVFYFRSVDIFSTWPFILLLLGAFVANERLKRHYVRFSFQVILFFLSVYSFMIFLVPVVFHRIGVWMFLLSGVLSVTFISVFISILFRYIKDKIVRDKYESKRMIIFLVFSVTLIVNVLYFTNLIPPIPLSLKDAGVYHAITKNADGNYVVSYEDHGIKGYFEFYTDFNKVQGSPVYVFSAIFSPKDLNLTIIHEWQHFDEGQNKWITETTISLPVIGGRDGGFRTYSVRNNLDAGKWRVNIKTEQNQIIGHVRFNILPADREPVLKMDMK